MNFNTSIVRLLSILQFFLLFAFVMHYDGLVSFVSQIVLVCGVLLIISLLTIRTKYDFIALLVYVFLLCINSLSYELMIRTICFVMMLSAFELGRILHIDKTTYHFLFTSYVLQALFLLIISTTPLAYSFDYEGTNGYYLALGFSNPNATGVILFSIIFTLIAILNSRFLKVKKTTILAFLLIIFFLLRLLYLTNSRTSFLVCVLTILLYVFFKLRKSFTPIPRAFIILITLIPVIYYYLYMYVILNGYFSGMEFLGKPLLSGRDVVFDEVNSLWTNLWFGNLDKLAFANSHNMAVTLLANVGMIGFVILIFYYISRLMFYNKMGRCNISFLALLALFIHGCNEAVMFTGGSIYYIYVLNFCLLSSSIYKKNSLG